MNATLISAFVIFLGLANQLIVSSAIPDDELETNMINEFGGDNKIRAPRSVDEWDPEAAAIREPYEDGQLARSRRENWLTKRLRKAGRFVSSPFRKVYHMIKRKKYNKYKHFYKSHKYGYPKKIAKYDKYKNFYKFNKYNRYY